MTTQWHWTTNQFGPYVGSVIRDDDGDVLFDILQNASNGETFIIPHKIGADEIKRYAKEHEKKLSCQAVIVWERFDEFVEWTRMNEKCLFLEPAVMMTLNHCR